MSEPVKAHDQRTTIHILAHVPEHEVRSHDSHYHLFEASRKRIKAAGLWKCAIHGCTFPGPLEAHHSAIEYSLQAGVDLTAFNEAYGLHLADDEEFRVFIESPGALEILCPTHHRTHLGIHSLPEPFWKAMRVWRPELPPPAEVIIGTTEEVIVRKTEEVVIATTTTATEAEA